MRQMERLSQVNSLLILIMFPLFFVPVVGTGVSIVLLLLLSLALLPFNWRQPLDKAELGFIGVTVLYFMVDVFDAARGSELHWLNTPSRFILLIPIMLYLRRIGYTKEAFWLSIAAGAVVGAAVGGWDFLANNASRAQAPNFRIIGFGNMGFLFSILAYAWFLSSLKEIKNVSKVKWAIVATTFICGVIMVILSGSRGPASSLVLSLMILPFFAGYRPSLRLTATSLTIPLMIIAFFAFTDNAVKDRTMREIQKLESYEPLTGANYSTGMRLDLAVIGWHQFIANPIVGSGKRATREYQTELTEAGRLDPYLEKNYLHNVAIDRAAYTGAIGLVSLALLYGLPLWIAFRSGRQLSLSSKLALVCVCLYGVLAGLTNITMYRASFATFYTILIVLIMQPDNE